MTARLAYKIHSPPEFQQLTSQMLEMEGFCICGRLIQRLEGKFILAAVTPSNGMTAVAAYCQPCSQVLNRALLGLRKVSFMDNTESIPGPLVPRNERPAS